jgi:hypothetical protein
VNFTFLALSFADVFRRSHNRYGSQLIIEYRLGLQIHGKLSAVWQDNPMIDIARLPLIENCIQGLAHTITVFLMDNLKERLLRSDRVQKTP